MKVSFRSGCASLGLVVGLALAGAGPAAAAKIAFSIDGTANYDPSGGLSLSQLSGFAANGSYYIDAAGTFGLTFDPPSDPNTLLDGPVSLSLSGSSIGSAVSYSGQFSSVIGSPVPYGALVGLYDSIASAVEGDPTASGVVNYILSHDTGSVVVGGTDYADYVYSYTGTLAGGITGKFAVATPYAVDLANSGLSINPGALNFDASIQLAPVPEPGTWAMLLLGVGGVGVVLRRRSGLAVAAD